MPGVVPAVADFVLVQQTGGGFAIEDADDHSIPSSSNLTSIDSVIQLYDLNADGVTDLLIKGLDGYIKGAVDQIVFSGNEQIYDVPENHVAVDATFQKFFSDLAEWIRNPAYLEGNVSVGGKLPVVKRDEDENEEEYLRGASGASGSLAYSVYGVVSISIDLWNLHVGNCVGYTSVLCLLIGEGGYWSGPQSIRYGDILLSAGNPYELVISVRSGDSSTPSDVSIYNTSGYDYDARFLALNVLRQYRDSKTLDPGSRFAQVISETLETILDVEVFGGILEDAKGGTFPAIEKYCDLTGTECDIIEVLEYILYRVRQVLILCASDDPDECEAVPYTIPTTAPVDDDSDPYVEITKVGSDDLVISTVPAMPPATFNAEVKGLTGSGYEIDYAWSARLYYRGTGERRMTYQVDREVEEEDENGNKVKMTKTEKIVFWVDKHHDFMASIPQVGSLPGVDGTSVFNNNWAIP